MATLAELLGDYEAGPGLLRKAVADLTPEQLRARPVEGRWSVLEVVCHLADFEPVLADRMKRVLALDKPLLMGADEKLFATRLAYHDRDPAEELAVIDATRKQMARVLRAAPPDVGQRVGVHSERGTLTLEQLLAGAARHIVHHLAFVQEKRRALGV
jgi:uncharacterized damage-inducible protein DinB